MRIAEILSPEARPNNGNSGSPSQHHQLLLSQIESSIKQFEQFSPDLRLSQIAADLRFSLPQLSRLVPFPNSVKLHVWKLSYRLWNACVDLANASFIRKSSASEDHAKLRQVAADMLHLVVDVSGVPSPIIKTASFYYKTGVIWHDLRKFDFASTCLEKATDLVSKLEINRISEKGERKLLLDLNLARSRTAWEVLERNLAVTLLNRAKCLLFGSSEHYKALASQFLAFGKRELSKEEACNASEALRLMNEALELCEKGSSASRTREEALDLNNLKLKTLRFISAIQLQNGEYEGVLKCVKILRDGEIKDQHPSLPVLAMKAWLGLGRYAEAEKELRGMVVNKGIPEGVWVSAVEAYFQAAGTAGAETAKGVFLGLLGRCHVSAGAAVRVVHRVIGDNGGGGEGSQVRARVVGELVSDDRVVALFAGASAAKERTAMHSVLWNCAAGHFRLKDYETSAEMFEKSMLYIPPETENRILRAKCFRVLGLCHLGLSQLDRAKEYINEADKLEHNTTTAFLKFKIYLQQNDRDCAISQLQAMMGCFDFTPDFLSLSAHEAVACRALSVAIASLSNLLNFYASGNPMPTAEVVVLRTLITILTQEPGRDPEILKFLSQAHLRASELDPDCFFGKGEVGRRERNWYAVMSWNFGIETGKHKEYELCMGFFKLASKFYSYLVDGQEEENCIMVAKSLILTVSAMLAIENERKAALSDAEVKQALELLDGTAKILKLISIGTQPNDDQVATIEPEFLFTYTLNAYEIYGRLDDGGCQQTHVIKTFASSKACNSKYLLQIGLSASESPRSNHEVATFALSECLSNLLSSLSPDYQNVAVIIRRLITLASVHRGDVDDDAVYGMYKQAYRIMVGLKEGEYPTEEGKWLAMTAWNRAAVPVRLGQTDMANKWMNVGLELSAHVSGMGTYKACMEDFLDAFRKKFGAHNEIENKTLVA